MVTNKRVLILGGVIAIAAAALVIADLTGSSKGSPKTYSMTASPASVKAPPSETSSGFTPEYINVDFTRVVESGSDDPFLLPVALPPGPPAPAPFLVTGFPITDRENGARTWMTEFTADNLPPTSGNVTGYTVYQVPASSKAPSCGSAERVVREVDDNRLSICLGPRPTKAAVEYWSNVEFSSQLSGIKWLNEKGTNR
jgi:hypothetical protein